MWQKTISTQGVLFYGHKFINYSKYQKRAQPPMEETYTYENALVQYLYHELPAGEAVEMVHLLEEDFEMHGVFDDLALAKTQLPKVQFNPSQAVLNRILQYSTKTSLEAQY